MTKKNVIHNYLYNLFYQILIIIVPLFTTPYLSRVLGAENIGIYSYTLSIATYFVLFGSLGIAMYGQREIAYLQEDKYKRSQIFLEIVLLRFITLTISLLTFWFMFAREGEYSIYYRILTLEIVANALDISWFFQGIEDFKKTVLRNTIVKLISVICIFIFINSEKDLYKYISIYVLSNLLGNFSLWLYLPKQIEKIPLNKINIFRHSKSIINLFIPQIAVQIYTVLDKTMIGYIIDDKSEVGFYDQAQKIIKLLLTLATSLGTVMIPRIANTFALGDKIKLKKYIYKSFSFVLLISIPLMFGIISISNIFVPIFFGQNYDKVIYLINIISPILIAISLSNVIGTQYLIPTKQQNKLTISVTIGAIINFIFNIIFIRKWKSIGASIATVIAEWTVTLVQFWLVRKEINIIEIIKCCKNYFVSGIIMFTICSIINYLLTNNILSMVFQILCGIFIYIGFLIIKKDQLIIEGINMLKVKIQQKNNS